jgi:hypothetical protein
MECGFANVSAAPGDFGSRVPSPPECFDLSDCFRRQDRLATEPNPFVQGEPDAVHLPLAANVILEFGNESEDAHDELAGARGCVDAWVIDHLEGYSLLGGSRDDAVKV